MQKKKKLQSKVTASDTSNPGETKSQIWEEWGCKSATRQRKSDDEPHAVPWGKSQDSSDSSRDFGGWATTAARGRGSRGERVYPTLCSLFATRHVWGRQRGAPLLSHHQDPEHIVIWWFSSLCVHLIYCTLGFFQFFFMIVWMLGCCQWTVETELAWFGINTVFCLCTWVVEWLFVSGWPRHTRWWTTQSVSPPSLQDRCKTGHYRPE